MPMRRKSARFPRYLACGIALFSGMILQAAASDQTAVSDEQLKRAGAADIVLLGEVHDNPHHHQFQAQFIEHLNPTVVVFEMLSEQQAQTVTFDLLQNLDALGEALGWVESGWPDFDIYKPVFAAIDEAAIVGAAVEPGKVRQAFAEGAATVFGPGHDAFGLDQALPAAQQEQRELLQFEAHCEAMPMNIMGGMVEAQRMRDAAFADKVLKALDTYGSPVVLVAGHGHTRNDWAVPHMINTARSEISVISVGMLNNPQQDAPFDLVIVKDHPVDEDPCDAFK